MKVLKLINKYKNPLKKLFFCFNITTLLVNCVLLFIFFKSLIIYKQQIFKNSDDFNINLLKQTYNKISNYLIEKYNFNNKNNSNKVMPNKKIIKLKSIAQVEKMNDKWLENKLGENFILKNDESPDYLIYNVYSNDDRNPKYAYTNPIRLSLFTENVMADLNYADYIIGPYHINYLDRYFKYPTFLLQDFSDIEKIRNEAIKTKRKKFCAAVISNCSPKFRSNFIKELSKYKKIDMGGSCWNTLNYTVKNKIKFLSSYKFSIAMENSEGDCYISEKIIDSFKAGTIPIYYGDYMIDEFINPKSYILIKGEKDLNKKIEYIKKIDKDDSLYESIMKEKPIIDKEFKNKIDGKELISFLQNIFMQDKNKAYRRDNNYYDFYCNKSIT